MLRDTMTNIRQKTHHRGAGGQSSSCHRQQQSTQPHRLGQHPWWWVCGCGHPAPWYACCWGSGAGCPWARSQWHRPCSPGIGSRPSCAPLSSPRSAPPWSPPALLGNHPTSKVKVTHQNQTVQSDVMVMHKKRPYFHRYRQMRRYAALRTKYKKCKQQAAGLSCAIQRQQEKFSLISYQCAYTVHSLFLKHPLSPSPPSTPLHPTLHPPKMIIKPSKVPVPWLPSLAAHQIINEQTSYSRSAEVETFTSPMYFCKSFFFSLHYSILHPALF